MSEKIPLYDASDEYASKHPGDARRMAVEAALELIRAYSGGGYSLANQLESLGQYADHIQAALKVAK